MVKIAITAQGQKLPKAQVEAVRAKAVMLILNMGEELEW